MLIVDVVVRDDRHAQLGERAARRAPYPATELVFGYLASRIELLAVHELGDLVIVVRDGIDHVALDLSGVGDGSEDARSRDQARAATLAAAGDA